MGRSARSGLVALGILVLVVGLAGCRSAGGGAGCGGCDAPPPGAADRPPEAQGGEVWCRVWVPPETTVDKRWVVCEEPSCEDQKVKPVWHLVTEPVCVRGPRECCVEIPAVYETITERVVVEPAHVEKRVVPGCGPLGIFDAECRDVRVPAKIETRCRKIMIRPQSWEKRCIPAEWGTRERWVCVRPAYWNSVPKPGILREVETPREVTPGRWEWRKNENCKVPEPAPCPPPCPPAPPPCPEPAPAPAPAPEPPPNAPADVPPAGSGNAPAALLEDGPPAGAPVLADPLR
jgi:hypothetical protein